MNQILFFIFSSILIVLSIQKKPLNDIPVIFASVKYSRVSSKFFVVIGEYDENAAAFGKYTPSYETQGWDYVTISSYQGNASKYTDEQKSYAMGYLEGYLTYQRIQYQYTNLKAYIYKDNNGEMPKSTRQFLIDNYKFLEKNVALKKESDPYWAQINTIIQQYKGMNDGYNKRAELGKKISFIDFQILSASGDISELAYYKSPLSRPNLTNMSSEEIINWIYLTTHCSAMIKVASDFSDLWFAHNTWFSYSLMIKMFKEYKFKSNQEREKSKVVAFSSYPGCLESTDDYYITDTDLYVTETTNSIFNSNLYDQLNPESVLTWMRVMVANRLTSSGDEWTKMFAQYNSGTYNCQFQVLDMKLIDTEQKKIFNGAFYIIEQIPGKTEINDMTWFLKKGYWPSYNIPFSPDIRKESGYDAYVEKHPDLFNKVDYSASSRATIFRRDEHLVKDIDSFKKFIRYNDFKNDPLSNGDSCGSIACRKDLDVKKPQCFGMQDAKLASIKDLKGKTDKVMYIISGPSNQEQPTFDWTTTTCQNGKSYFIHEGQVDKWDFPWIEYHTKLFA